jgi:predicted nucleic acid-binding protein
MSTSYLVDTNVVSVGGPTNARPTPDLASWMERASERLYLSVITVAEVEDGIHKARREGASRKAERLATWLETLLHLYTARILAVDLAVARAIGPLSDHARGAGHATGLADIAIAATARVHGHIVLTRNIPHFRMLDVPVHDPFASLPLG